MSSNEHEKNTIEVTHEEGTPKKSKTGIIAIVLIICLCLCVVINVLSDPYPEAVPIDTLYAMDYPGDYINQHIGEKVQYSNLFIWQVDSENGIAQDLFTKVNFRDKTDVNQIHRGSIITVKGTIEGLVDSRLVLRDAVLVDVDDSRVVQSDENSNAGDQSEEFLDSDNINSTPDDYYDVAITGDQLIEEADANIARVLNTYTGKRVMISDLEIKFVNADSAAFDVATSIYFRNVEDLYSINAGDRITVIASIEETTYGSYCITDAVLLEAANANEIVVDDNQPSDTTSTSVDFGEFEGEYHMAHNYTIQMDLWFDSDMSGVNSSNWQGYEPLELHFFFTDTYENEILGDGIAYWWPLSDGLPYFEGELYSSLEPITLEYDGYNFIVNCSALELQEASFFKD